MNDHKPLRIATFLAPNIYPVFRFIAEYIGRKLDLATEILFVESHDDYDEADADVSFICRLPYVLWKDTQAKPIELLAAPVLLGKRYQDKPIYFSDVIVRQDSPYQSFADLRGRTWGYNEKVSQSGYGITRHRLVQMAETNGFFGNIVSGRSHQNTMKLVAKDLVDGGAIDTQVLEVEFNNRPQYRATLRIIDTFGPSPIQPIVVKSSLSDNLKAAVQAVMLEMSGDITAQIALSKGLFKRFVPIADSDYDPIREMVEQARSAGFMTIR